MSTISPILLNAAIGHNQNILSRIREEAINIAIWQRSVQQLDDEFPPLLDQHINLKTGGSREQILQFLQAELIALGLGPSQLLLDIDHLMEVFQEVTGVAHFRFALMTVSTNMCRKFHTDVNTLRMLCTYSGQGTMWVAENSLSNGTGASHSGPGQLEPSPENIQQVQAGEVVILKGALYPNGNAVLHRSPTIEESGTKRLLLRIDTNESLIS